MSNGQLRLDGNFPEWLRPLGILIRAGVCAWHKQSPNEENKKIRTEKKIKETGEKQDLEESWHDQSVLTDIHIWVTSILSK